MSSEWLTTLESGEEPQVLHRMRTGWAVLGSTQHLPGYCLLVYAGSANHLTDLPRPERMDFLFDLSLLGEAVSQVCAARDEDFLRINYEVLGNLWPHLHGHVHARYSWEEESLRVGPVYLYRAERTKKEHAISAAHNQLHADLRAALSTLARDAYDT
ncbi:HIT family protein [Protofrankia symbiont of Coriaria ruscifolia]|uniref:HIT family protein n=1 Tax=Protofrankia symbiont of Coriaria ruscifolia TaxID=1306542 RepID=UPI001F5E98F5|nr:HIT domain-containing protein [Protofrankia symbiont of Coriaria ruscifolia]